eukprot:3658843-Amphidinium_carterae.1
MGGNSPARRQHKCKQCSWWCNAKWPYCASCYAAWKDSSSASPQRPSKQESATQDKAEQDLKNKVLKLEKAIAEIGDDSPATPHLRTELAAAKARLNAAKPATARLLQAESQDKKAITKVESAQKKYKEARQALKDAIAKQQETAKELEEARELVQTTTVHPQPEGLMDAAMAALRGMDTLIANIQDVQAKEVFRGCMQPLMLACGATVPPATTQVTAEQQQQQQQQSGQSETTAPAPTAEAVVVQTPIAHMEGTTQIIDDTDDEEEKHLNMQVDKALQTKRTSEQIGAHGSPRGDKAKQSKN